MIGVLIGDTFVDFANSDIICPNCNHNHKDKADKVTDRINRNKTWITKLTCECSTRFKITVCYTGDFETFI